MTNGGRSRARRAAVAAAIAAAAPAFWLWGYTVDDALIPVRVALHLHEGAGHRFNATGALADAVTPLGWAHLLAPFARGTAWTTLLVAKVLGAAAWIAAAAWLGGAIVRAGAGRARLAVLLPLAACAPVAAWAVAGLETGLVLAACTFALARHPVGWVCAGLAAGWRPELIPWALTLAVGTALAARRGPKGVAVAATTALAPAVGVAAVRVAAFGRVAPLSAWAKPSDLEHGLFYGAAALLWTGLPLLLVSPRGLRRLPGHEAAVLAACLVHWLAVVAAGGDWMPFFRLLVPVLPGLLLVAAAVAERTPPWATAARTAAAAVVCVTLMASDAGRAARHVVSQRRALVERAEPVLRGAQRVAALDVGWVGVATRAEVIDLAGVTDERVALLTGPHHAKRLPRDFIDRRELDALVLLLAPGEAPHVPWEGSAFARAVESRLATLARGQGFRLAATLPLEGADQAYLVLKRAPELGAAAP